MARITLIILFGLATVAFPASVVADEPPPPSGDDVADVDIDAGDTDADEESTRRSFDADHRREIYEQSRLQPWRAVVYTAAFPGIGNFYAEQYALGTVAMMSMVFASMFAGFGLMYNRPDLARLGAGIATVAYTGAGISSYLGVRSYNRQLRRNLHVDDDYRAAFNETYPPVGIHWTWRF